LQALVAEGRREIKIWSSACSTGAEPYTIAMVMDEFCATQRGVDFSILCTDICTEVLDQAVAGRFTDQMIEPVSTPRRQRYVMRARDPGRSEVRIIPRLRAKLAFARLNLMDEAYPVETNLDIIFCRNILIYFDKATQAKVLRRLCAHLRPGGYLFLGHSESIVGIDLPVRQIANTVFQKQ
jgi:chemotaxis protein methyltransferase CheR